MSVECVHFSCQHFKSRACSKRVQSLVFLTSQPSMIRMPNKLCSHHITSHHITSHHITSHHITSHHITSHHITSHHITSHHNTSHHITSHHITSHHNTSHHVTCLRPKYLREELGQNSAKHQVRISDGKISSLSIADGPWIRADTVRSNDKKACTRNKRANQTLINGHNYRVTHHKQSANDSESTRR